jgi:hypothetical protein
VGQRILRTAEGAQTSPSGTVTTTPGTTTINLAGMRSLGCWWTSPQTAIARATHVAAVRATRSVTHAFSPRAPRDYRGMRVRGSLRCAVRRIQCANAPPAHCGGATRAVRSAWFPCESPRRQGFGEGATSNESPPPAPSGFVQTRKGPAVAPGRFVAVSLI